MTLPHSATNGQANLSHYLSMLLRETRGTVAPDNLAEFDDILLPAFTDLFAKIDKLEARVSALEGKLTPPLDQGATASDIDRQIDALSALDSSTTLHIPEGWTIEKGSTNDATLVAQPPAGVKLTKAALETLQHMSYYGGDIQFDKDDGKYYRSWGTLLKDDGIKWHRRHISTRTFEQLKPLLTLASDESDELLGFTLYEIGPSGWRFLDDAALSAAGKAATK